MSRKHAVKAQQSEPAFRPSNHCPRVHLVRHVQLCLGSHTAQDAQVQRFRHRPGLVSRLEIHRVVFFSFAIWR